MSCIFFFNDTATTEIYTLSLHDALPISDRLRPPGLAQSCFWSLRLPHLRKDYRPPLRPTISMPNCCVLFLLAIPTTRDRKSTRLNSSHSQISYAVFCLKKKTNNPLSHVSPSASTYIAKPPSFTADTTGFICSTHPSAPISRQAPPSF